MNINRQCQYALFFSLLVASVNLVADVISPAPDKVNLTVYRSDAYSDELISLNDSESTTTGLVMVSETRSIDLPAGESRIVFRGVADAMIPQTAKLRELNGSIVESNFDYSLISPYDLINKSVGKPVLLASTNLQTGQVTEHQAIIRSGTNGVLLEIDGKLEEFNCGGNPQRLIFPSIPLGLTSEPTLSVVVRTPQAGHVQLALSYLAVGIQWSADYVANINLDGKTLNLSAWITLVNARSTSFANAPVQVVAGKIEHNQEETIPPKLKRERAGSSCWPAISSPKLYSDNYGDDVEEIVITGIKASAGLSELGDYKLYTLPTETTVAAFQSKQVLMLAHEQVIFDHIYTYQFSVEELRNRDDFDSDEINIDSFKPITVLRFANTKKNNLGIPLPSGNVSVMNSGAQHSLFVGQHHIQDISVGSTVEIILGKEPDIVINRRVTLVKENKDKKSRRVKIDISVSNYKSSASDVEVKLYLSEYYDTKIISESAPHVVKNDNHVWRLKLRAGETRHLRYEANIKEIEY